MVEEVLSEAAQPAHLQQLEEAIHSLQEER